MVKITLPASLRSDIVNALAQLPPPAKKTGQLARAALIAEDLIKHYHREIPQLFAAHAAPFFRSQTHAWQIGQTTDAFELLTNLRSHAIALQTAPSAPENIEWLKGVFGCALSGQLHLRREPHES